MPTELEVLRARVQEAEAEVRRLRAELDQRRASEANCFGRIIDRGQVLDIKQLIRECNAEHKAEVERLLARIRQIKEAHSNLEALGLAAVGDDPPPPLDR